MKVQEIIPSNRLHNAFARLQHLRGSLDPLLHKREKLKLPFRTLLQARDQVFTFNVPIMLCRQGNGLKIDAQLGDNPIASTFTCDSFQRKLELWVRDPVIHLEMEGKFDKSARAWLDEYNVKISTRDNSAREVLLLSSYGEFWMSAIEHVASTTINDTLKHLEVRRQQKEKLLAFIARKKEKIRDNITTYGSYEYRPPFKIPDIEKVTLAIESSDCSAVKLKIEFENSDCVSTDIDISSFNLKGSLQSETKSGDYQYDFINDMVTPDFLSEDSQKLVYLPFYILNQLTETPEEMIYKSMMSAISYSAL